MKKILIFVVTFFSVSTILYSQEITYGVEFQVNTYTNHNQIGQAAASLQDGGFVICWTGYYQDGARCGIFSQIFDFSGNKRGNEFQVNTYTDDKQFDPAVASLQDGGFVICWTSRHQDGYNDGIFGQMFDASGNKKGSEFQVNTFTDYDQTSPAVTSLQNGGFVTCWTSWGQDGSEYGIYGQMFDVSGNKKGTQFNVNTNTYTTIYHSAVASLQDSGFVICWTSWDRWGQGGSVFAQMFDVSGKKRGNEFQVNTFTEEDQAEPAVASLQDSGFVICWESEDQDGSSDGIFGQMFDASGNKEGNEFQVNTFTEDAQFDPAVASLQDSGFVICWTSYKQDGSKYGIFGQMFDVSGIKKGNEFPVNTVTKDFQIDPAVVSLHDIGFVIGWESDSHVGSKMDIIAKLFPSEPIIHQLMPFSLVEPNNDATLNTTDISFYWQQPSSIVECFPWEMTFDLFIDTDYNFSNPQVIKDIIDTTFTVGALTAGQTYFWKVLAKNVAGDSIWSTQQNWGFFIKHGASSVKVSDVKLPGNFMLQQNYPNPFNSQTEIKYSLPEGKNKYHVVLKIYDVLGRLVKALVDKDQSRGVFSVSWDGTDLSGNSVVSGVYIYSLEVGEFKVTKKMLLLE